MIYNLDLLGIGDAIRQALRTLSGRIAALIYELIDNLYVVFIYISKAEILEASFIEQIYTKVGMILGIFMVFKLTFSLIQALIEPEKLNDQKKGFSSIISRSVIAIVLLGITPSLFREAFKIQNLIVGSENSNNIIYKLIVGNNVSGNFKDMGRRISSDLYFSFFRDDNYPYLNNGAISNYGSNDRFPIDNYDNLVTNIEEKKVINGHEMGFDDTVDYLAIKFGNIYCIEYNEIFSIAFGLVVAWMFISYCIQVGARVVQLAYLQLIAPVPILSYISDPEGSFKKWISQCVTTYLDLFIRLAIIYFVMTAISDVLDQFNKASGVIFTSTGLDATDKGMFILVKIFIILGLLMFAKKVPELLKDLFPNLGGGAASLGFGIKSPKKTLADIPLLGGITNKVLGYAGNTGKKAGKWAWNKTGGKGINVIKGKYGTWKDDRTGYKEGYKKDKESEKAWAEYGSDFNNKEYKRAFRSDRDKTGEYAASYVQLEKASDALKNYTGDTNSADYRKLLADKEKAQKNHDVNREKYKDLARREDQLKRYANRHPEVKKNASSPSTSSSPSTTPPSMPNSYQSSNYKGANQPINEQNSMFANMSDEEWKARRSQNKQEIREERRNLREANQNDPNEYFDKMDQQYADEYLKNDGVSDDFDRQYETKRGQMEDAYKKAGWSQDSDGKWTKNGNGS